MEAANPSPADALLDPWKEVDRSFSRRRDLYLEEEDELTEFDNELDLQKVDATQVFIDPYNSDLNLLTYADRPFVIEPYVGNGFAHMLASGRATFAVHSGRVGFEVKFLSELQAEDSDFRQENCWHEVRVGWTADDQEHLRLGESTISFAYCNNGRRATAGRFAPWAENFWPDDVVSCLVDFDGERTVSFCKNGKPLGVAFRLEESVDTGQGVCPLFPAVTLRNVQCEVNFGQREEPWFPLPEGYSFINDVPLSDRIRGPQPSAASKEECTVLMMIGLPGCGKSTWVDAFIAEHSEQRWTVLSPSLCLDQMAIQGVPLRKLHQGRWDIVMGTAAKCFLRLLQLACRKRKNYIIDGTNAYPAARKRKLSAFREFYRKAVVIVPAEEDYAYRCLMESTNRAKRVPAEVLMEMKASFVLPKLEEGHFNEIVYVELQEEDASYVVSRYNEEGRNAKPPEKRRRLDTSGGGGQEESGASHQVVLHLPKKRIVPPKSESVNDNDLGTVKVEKPSMTVAAAPLDTARQACTGGRRAGWPCNWVPTTTVMQPSCGRPPI